MSGMKSKPVIMDKAKLFFKNNYIFVFFFVIVLIVGVFSLFRLTNAKQQTIYVRVKVSQGLWWANTMKPPIWMTQHFKKGDIEYSLTGQKSAEIVEVRAYPSLTQPTSDEQYSIFVTLKLYTGYNKAKGIYTFKRSPVAVGAPIDLEFTRVQTSGTITDMSTLPFKEQYVEKKVTISHPYIEQSEYEQITPGDSFHDGEETVLTVISKTSSPSTSVFLKNSYLRQNDTTVQAEVVLRMKVKKIQNQWVYNEEQVILPGLELSTGTAQYFFDRFKILRIE
jgi:hypothetical protein